MKMSIALRVAAAILAAIPKRCDGIRARDSENYGNIKDSIVFSGKI